MRGTLPTAPAARGRRGPDGSKVLVDPVHHRAELAALALDLVILLLGPHPLEVLLPGAVLGNPLLGELARLDLVEDLLHRLAGRLADDPLAAGRVPVLGRVGVRLAHPGSPLLVHHSEDQLLTHSSPDVPQPRIE